MDERILLIEDDAELSAALSERLCAAGFKVEVAPSAEEALERLDVSQFGAAVVDLALPGTDGAALLERLRSEPRLAHLPVIVHTAYPLTPRLRVKLLDADAVVEKDGRAEPLIAALDHVLSPASHRGVGVRAELPSAWR